MYGYPGQYGQPPGYGGYPGAAGPPPGMGGAPPATGGAPGMGPHGSGAPPGMNQANASLPPKPSGGPAGFQPPPNMAHINFNAPVIRLGTAAPAGAVNAPGPRNPAESRRGLGMENNQRPRDALVPPTREEVFRSIFIGKIPDSFPDADMEKILRAAGSLRRWTRAVDATGKACSFGFAEYEDAESLETAIEVLPGTEVPSRKLEPKNGNSDAETEPEKTRLLVQIDDASRKYADEWREKRGDDESAVQFRVDTARESLGSVFAGIFNPSETNMDGDGDAFMQDVQSAADPVTGEIITIPLTAGEDELADIPPEMRETVAAEIAAFRDRSNRRDLERLRREEEIEAAERRTTRANRSSPPLSAPTGPAGSTNGIPLGPRGAPSGPKVSQNGTNTSGTNMYATQEEDDSEASDEELETRRQEKKQAEQEKAYLDYERRWLNREKSRAAAIDREKLRDDDESTFHDKKQQTAAKRFKEFDDDSEHTQRNEEYYRDKSSWLRSRATFRAREKEFDDRDRAQEEREKARDHERKEHNRELADSFLDRQAEEISSRATREPQRLKISLGAAAQRAQAAAPRRILAEVEGLLEDEEEADTTTKRTLIPIKFDTAAEAAGLTEEERKQAARQLASDIPTEKEGLWAWNIQWDFVDDSILKDQIRPFVEKKMVEYLGVLEEMLVDVVEEHIRKRGSPEELVGELEGPLDEEAEIFVKKLWRMIIFCSESEKRGLSG